MKTHTLNDDQLTWLLGALTAQGYLLETLIGFQALAQGRLPPIEALEMARDALQKQIRFDMRVPPTDNPHADHLAIQAAASKHLDEMIDRVRTQLENKPTSGGANE